MTAEYSVHDEPDFARTYDEDEVVEIRKGDLRAALDVATMSMDFGSGFLDNEQVEALRKLAELIGMDPLLATPSNFVCQYKGGHVWRPFVGDGLGQCCTICHHVEYSQRPAEEPATITVPTMTVAQ